MKFHTILWRCDLRLHVRSPIGIAAGTSGGAFTEIACVFGMDFTRIPNGTALTGISFIGTPFTGISFGFGDTVCFSKGSLPVRCEEDTEVLDLEQNF